MNTIDTIDRLLTNDLCEEMDMLLAFHPEELNEREKAMAELLATLYRVAHGRNRKNSCYHAHDSWRKESLKISKALAKEK
jgi:hypothetical protein